MLTAIATAHFANTPLLVLASNRTLASEDSYKAIQYIVQQNQTQGLRKYGKRITTPERIYEYGSYAFRHLKSGVPGVAHLDFPAEIADARFTDSSKLVNYFESAKSHSDSRAMPNPSEVRKAVEMIGRAERPVIVAGHGIHVRRAHEALLRAAEKNDIGVISSGPVRGIFPDEHRLSLSMANDALKQADLVIFIGQYLMPSPGEWTMPTQVATIRVNPEVEEIGRNWPIDLGIVLRRGLFPRGAVRRLAVAQARDLGIRYRDRPEDLDDHPARLLRTGADPFEIHRRAAPGGAVQGPARLSVQGRHRSETDAIGIWRSHHRRLCRALAAGVSPRPGDRHRTTSSAPWVPRSP